ncbi:hypothetical protein [Halotia branconii]|uniref:Uncharacterized protein n=1 Tax=Halotia branconii CENA392 TaxID=1539056 RepID=A0AAJ6P8C8_9CYAN|nr:hypothetical protein [Halotia branconii]WGV24481.1 hypothetical protein QI031_22285 [Halotia branconii CENA392]
MSEIQIAIESEDAPKAAAALLEIEGISGSYEVPTQREGTLAAIATIVGIVGGTAALAEQIRKWYQEAKQAHPHKVFDVIIVNPQTHSRIFMEEATIEEITEILKSLG